MDINIQGTTNFQWLNENWDKGKMFILEGSTRSSKTISIVQKLILVALTNPGIVIRCVRADGTTHKESTIADMDFVLGPEMFNLKHDHHYKKNIQNKKYKFINKSTITFSATNDPQKLHGMKQNILWLNEIMEIPLASYRQLAQRTSDKIILDFNPSYNHHWVFNHIGCNNKPLEGKYYKHSTYKDNQFLSPEQVAIIEQADPSKPENVKNGTANAFHWDVYGLGKRGRVEGAVFNQWESTEFWPDDPRNSIRWGLGLDFGFSVDPTAIVECVIHPSPRGLYLRERLYETNILVSKNYTQPNLKSIEGELKKMDYPQDLLIIADGAQPESIMQLRTSGFNITGVKKGKNSILTGINIMKKFKIYVHEESENLKIEMEHYRWKIQNHKDKDPQLKPEPVDDFNHLIDAARYWCMMNVGDMRHLMPTSQAGSNQMMRKPRVKSRVRQR